MTALTIRGVDPRSQSEEHLSAPSPLPFISRRALARVKDRLEAPSVCNCCGGSVELVSNAEIYAGREYGEWPYAYLCRKCGAYVGLHSKTDLPLGTLADKVTRTARRTGKDKLLSLTQSRFGGDRSAAYQWLASRMELEPEYCHFGMFTLAQCKQAERIMKQATDSRSQS